MYSYIPTDGVTASSAQAKYDIALNTYKHEVKSRTMIKDLMAGGYQVHTSVCPKLTYDHRKYILREHSTHVI